MQPSVVVTGVSSGIGRAVTQSLTAKGFLVFGSVRTHVDAERLQKEFGERVIPLIFDITDRHAVAKASGRVRDMLGGRTLSGLVNNAGMGTAAPLLHVPIDEFRQQLEVNLIGPLNVIQHFAPLLQSQGTNQGRIVNIGSTASRIGIPFFGAYTASKHALEGLSESLRRELLIHQIDVITVIPGPVRTAIWNKAQGLDFTAYRDTPYAGLLEAFRDFMVHEGRNGLEPSRIGNAVLLALTKRRPRSTYIIVPGQFKNWTIPTTLPSRWIDKLLGKKLGLIQGS